MENLTKRKRKKILKYVALFFFVFVIIVLPFCRHFKNTATYSYVGNSYNIVASEEEKVELKQGDYIFFGQYLGEPILWKVADVTKNGKTLLMSEYILCFKAFDSCSGKNRERDVRKYGSSNWDICTLNQWLNSKNNIVEYRHSIPNAKNVMNGMNAYSKEAGFLNQRNFTSNLSGSIVGDVFVPSEKMLKKYNDGKLPKKYCTKSAIKNNNSGFILSTKKAMWYWMKDSVSSNNVSVAAVTSSGSKYKSLAYDSLTGVCPALYVKTNFVVSIAGNGEMNNPYIIGSVL